MYYDQRLEHAFASHANIRGHGLDYGIGSPCALQTERPGPALGATPHFFHPLTGTVTVTVTWIRC